jgi:predicted ester cyclase
MPTLFTASLAKHLVAENAHDVDAILATYGANPNVVINGQSFSGRAAVRMFHERFGFGSNGSFSDVCVTELHRYPSEGAIILELLLAGTHTARWMGLEATGRRFEVPVCTVYLFEESGLLAGEHVYFDTADLRRQLAT